MNFGLLGLAPVLYTALKPILLSSCSFAPPPYHLLDNTPVSPAQQVITWFMKGGSCWSLNCLGAGISATRGTLEHTLYALSVGKLEHTLYALSVGTLEHTLYWSVLSLEHVLYFGTPFSS